MEVEEINSCKRSKTGGRKCLHRDADEDEREAGNMGSRLLPWQQHSSSRIYRVSRTSGGKDRHSKVITAKGLRDRRVRLSVSTAIQFYDLQDRLGYDQPSKAIEWLIKAASAAIGELPSLDGSFLEPPKEMHAPGEEQIGPEMEAEAGQEQQPLSVSRSGCSSTSETSKGSVLSLSRSENRIKARERARLDARERARERAAKEKDSDEAHTAARHQHGVNPSLKPQSSFTELLTGGRSGGNGAVAEGSPGSNGIQKQLRQLPAVTATADYFGQSSIVSQSDKNQHSPLGFSFQSQFGNISPSSVAGDHPEMQQFAFLQDHLIPVVATAPAGDYGLNFSIPGLAAYNRGTLQSNSPFQVPRNRLQKLSSAVDGSNLPLFFSTPATASAESQFPPGFDGRLQLCYGDSYRHADLKGKGKT